MFLQDVCMVVLQLMSLSFAGSRASEVITPKRDREFALERVNVTLSCNYSGSALSVHWYRQYTGSHSLSYWKIQRLQLQLIHPSQE